MSEAPLAAPPVRRRRWAVVALAAFALGAALVAPWGRDWYALHAARWALQAYDPAAAEAELARCRQRWPEETEVRLLAAQAARLREEYARAEVDLAACERQDGRAEAVRLERALWEAQQGQTSRAEALLHPLQQPDDSWRELARALAWGHARAYRPADALRIADELLRQQPDDVVAHFCRGLAQEGFEHADDAVADYRHALALAPRFPPVRRRLAEVLYRLGHPGEAAEHFEALRQEQPADPVLLLGLARCRLDLAEPAEARRLLDALLAERPDDAPALLERGRLAWRAQQLAPAEQDVRRFTTLAPGSLDGQLLLRRCLQEQSAEAEVRACTARVEKIEAETARVHGLMARAVEAPPDIAQLQEIGSALLALDRGPEALPWLFRALQGNPHYPPAHAALADYYRRQSQPDLALLHATLSHPDR